MTVWRATTPRIGKDHVSQLPTDPTTTPGDPRTRNMDEADELAALLWPEDRERPAWVKEKAIDCVVDFHDESARPRRVMTLNAYGQRHIVTMGPLNPALPPEPQHEEAALRCYRVAMSRVRNLISCASGSWRYQPDFPPTRLQAEIRRFWPRFFTSAGYDATHIHYGPCLELAGRLDLPMELEQLMEAAVHVSFISLEEAGDLRRGWLIDLGILADVRVPGLAPGPSILLTRLTHDKDEA